MIVWPISSWTDLAQKISGTNSNEDLNTPAIILNSAEIFRFLYTICSMLNKDLPIHFLRSGMKFQ